MLAKLMVVYIRDDDVDNKHVLFGINVRLYEHYVQLVG